MKHTATNDLEENIPVILNPTLTANLNYSISFRLGTKGKFMLIGGYAIPLSNKENAYEVFLPANNILVDDFTRSFMGLLHPDGLILGMKFMIGLGGN